MNGNISTMRGNNEVRGANIEGRDPPWPPLEKGGRGSRACGRELGGRHTECACYDVITFPDPLLRSTLQVHPPASA